MKMKRYFAADARTAIRELREEQGPDAVIISNRKVSGGVEIIAALDYEDALVNESLGKPYTGAATELSDDSLATAAAADRQQNYKSGSDDLVSNESLAKIREELKGLRSIMEAPLMQFSWGEMGKVQPLYASLLKQLMALGLSPQLCETLCKKVSEGGLHKHSWLESLKLLAGILPVAEDDLMNNGGVVALVGPTGVGKTTTIAKIAARFALRHGRRNIALVTTDSYRIGAHEQLRTYGRILGIPVQVAADSEELQAVLKHNKDQKLTLIDTAGVSQRDLRLTEQLATLKVEGANISSYLVLSATAQMALQDDVINAFSKANLTGCILTKIDEAASLGESLSVLIKHDLPVAYVSDGQKVPDDLHPARGKLLVKEAVKLMQKSKRVPCEAELAYSFGGRVTHANV